MLNKKLLIERREKGMCRGMKALTVVSIVILVLVTTGLAHAAWEFVRIAHPNGTEKTGQFSMPLRSGTVYPVRLQFRNTTPAGDTVPARIASYKLSYTCRGDGGKWTTITVRTCSLYGFCPTKYPWEVPYLERKAGDIRSCMMKVEIFDDMYGNGNMMDQDKSNQWFDIDPALPIQ